MERLANISRLAELTPAVSFCFRKAKQNDGG